MLTIDREILYEVLIEAFTGNNYSYQAHALSIINRKISLLLKHTYSQPSWILSQERRVMLSFYYSSR